MENVYVDFAKDVEICFNTWNSEVDRLLPIGKIKKVIGLTKDELCAKIMTKFVITRPKKKLFDKWR